MTEMLDRIARAINPGLWDQALRGPYTVHVIPDNGASFTRGMSPGEIEDFRNKHQTKLRDRAREILTSMREPTEQMASAAGDAWGDAFGKAEDCWRTMIDEALK